MAKFIRPELRSVFQLTLFLLYSFICPSYGEAARDNHRSDLVTIRLSAPPEGYKMPEVIFLHDLHTDALDKNSCQKCHQKKETDFIFKYNRNEDLSYENGKELYHTGCIGCHEALSHEGMKAGPQTGQCRRCHKKEPHVINISSPFGMDQSLHFRHMNAQSIKATDDYAREVDGNCSACHHEYDAELKKTVYVKGKEGTCRYCHKEDKTGEVRQFKAVAHEDCINCHLRLYSTNINAGPFDCRRCHDATQQMEISKIKDIPRMKRNQPDVSLMSAWLKDTLRSEKTSRQFIRPIVFNHLSHEKNVELCRSCHHESLESCSSCHSRTGDKKGNFITLDHAMHSSTSSLSCIGCHRIKTQTKECAGCHTQLNQSQASDHICTDCHSIPKQSLEPLPLTKDAAASIAETYINNRQKPMRMTDDQIPEKVSISIMANQYEAAMMPHRQIVSALYNKTKNSGLTSFFHDEPTSLCKGCHHYSPSDDSFPKCASCHELSIVDSQCGKPGLLGAYHGQCITCHQQMEIDKPLATDCTACHKKREGNTVSFLN
jgi:hypothetical protein